MPCSLLAQRGSPWTKLLLHCTKYIRSPNSNLWLQQRHFSRYTNIYSSQMPILLCSLDVLGLKKGMTFSSMELNQSAQLSGKATKKPPENPTQISGRAVIEAQRSLIEYLHNTRDIPFSDAEYMIMNAPSFLLKFVSRTGRRSRKSFDKYLQYHAINEFEPLFESIGIGFSDINALLPPHQIYLTQNKLMMDNFTTLRKFGIPRNKLGKLYKEAREIFDYLPAILKAKLQAYEDLGVSKIYLARIFTCCPFLLKDNYEKVLKSLLDDLNQNQNQTEKNPIGGCLEICAKRCMYIIEIFEFFDRLGCPGEEVVRYVRTNLEALLKCKVESLDSKVKLFSKLGLKTEDIGSIFFQDPGILQWDLEGRMTKNIEILESIGLKPEEMREIVQLCPHALGTDRLKELIETMAEFGLREIEIAKLIRKHPKITSIFTVSKITAGLVQNMSQDQADRVKIMELLITGQDI